MKNRNTFNKLMTLVDLYYHTVVSDKIKDPRFAETQKEFFHSNDFIELTTKLNEEELKILIDHIVKTNKWLGEYKINFDLMNL